MHHLTGWPLTVAGAYLIERSWKAARQVELQHPALLVTSGPYAASRNPMYLGWALLQLGAGVVRGSWWMIAAVPAAAALVHREVRDEERTLEDAFGDEYRRYRATVPRYLPPLAGGRAHMNVSWQHHQPQAMGIAHRTATQWEDSLAALRGQAAAMAESQEATSQHHLTFEQRENETQAGQG